MGVHTSSACRLVGKWPLSWLGIPRESSGMLLSTARGVVPSRVALLLKAGVFLISPFLYRRAVIKRLGRFLGVPPQNLPSSTAGIRAVDPRTVRRAFADSQDPDVLDDVLRSKAPTLLISGEAELGDVRAANAALC
jgi:pimeloyl-ACP methyl ester carboxylesterase